MYFRACNIVVVPFHCSDSDEEPKQKEKRQKKGGSGLLAPLPVSDALVEFLGTGESELTRADAVKRMWEYIKQNDLQVCVDLVIKFRLQNVCVPVVKF